MKTILASVISLMLVSGANAQDSEISYGNDNGEFAGNGVCDDRRFDGPGTAKTRGWSAVGTDAQDCVDAVKEGSAHLWTLQAGIAGTDVDSLNFGDNTSEYADDGACDDPRFEGHGVTERPVEENVGHDAGDCSRLWEFGAIFMRDIDFDALPEPLPSDPFYGDDSGSYASDGECDDRRFVGEGMSAGLNWGETGRDATDCRSMVADGTVKAWDRAMATSKTICSAIEWGSDSGDYANDGTCDDYRFEGLGTAGMISREYIEADATDCRKMCDYGLLFLREFE